MLPLLELGGEELPELDGEDELEEGGEEDGEEDGEGEEDLVVVKSMEPKLSRLEFSKA